MVQNVLPTKLTRSVWSIKTQPKQLKKAEKDLIWVMKRASRCKLSVDHILKSLFPVAFSFLWEPTWALLSHLCTHLASFLSAYCCYKHYPHIASYVCLSSPPLHTRLIWVQILCACINGFLSCLLTFSVRVCNITSFACLVCVAAFFFFCVSSQCHYF